MTVADLVEVTGAAGAGDGAATEAEVADVVAATEVTKKSGLQ